MTTDRLWLLLSRKLIAAWISASILALYWFSVVGTSLNDEKVISLAVSIFAVLISYGLVASLIIDWLQKRLKLPLWVKLLFCAGAGWLFIILFIKIFWLWIVIIAVIFCIWDHWLEKRENLVKNPLLVGIGLAFLIAVLSALL